MTNNCCHSRKQKRRQKRRDRLAASHHLNQPPRFFIPLNRVDLRFWKSTVQILNENLENQYYYPFGVVSPFGVYKLQFTDDSFWYGVATLMLFIITFTIYILWTLGVFSSSVGRYKPKVALPETGMFTLLPFILIFAFLASWWIMSRLFVHTLIVDCPSLSYEIYKGKRLSYRGHFHNICIKLKSLATVKDRRRRDDEDDSRGFYYLTLNGFHLPPIFLSSFSRNYREMRRIGRRMAANFNINYVDKDEISKHHVIRHRCPHSPLNYVVGEDEALDALFEGDSISLIGVDSHGTRVGSFGTSRDRKSMTITARAAQYNQDKQLNPAALRR